MLCWKCGTWIVHAQNQKKIEKEIRAAGGNKEQAEDDTSCSISSQQQILFNDDRKSLGKCNVRACVHQWEEVDIIRPQEQVGRVLLMITFPSFSNSISEQSFSYPGEMPWSNIRCAKHAIAPCFGGGRQ